MQAVRVHPGATLAFEVSPDPEPADGEVVVALKAAGVNRRDLLVRSGVYPFPLPLIPGSDGAGTRRDTGEDVVILPSLHWGEGETAPGPDFQILGGPRNGTYAELVAVPEENVFPKPADLSWDEAAAFPLAAVTAYRALFTRGTARAGETVLVLGAGSGVSTFAVQLAARAGLRVLVTSSSAEKIARARELGAADGFGYWSDDWPEQVAERGPVDLVLDSVGATWPASIACVRPGGRVVSFGATAAAEATLDVRGLYLQQKSLIGTTMGSPRDFAAVLDQLADGLRPVVDSSFALSEAEAAHARLEDAEHFGKIVLVGE
jgi:zinc-binding alcohol dehydrogenase/oxidoreductase